ncbi:ATP-binding protein [Micromonospora olivasterospora]|uniref:Putative ATPase n=1 Tax=Micromonospora olivasterospora TaxID=1880 RepID=A0A562I9F7_MICOL|nr:AAA family ATPase [Micromonospora olivasterospora]TWH67408.1 putative ATPase [Micromonospora olivasterospora]
MPEEDNFPLPVLVGRDRERDILYEGLSQARHGHGGCVIVVGGDGTGKSRLVREAVRRARHGGMSVLLGRTGSTGPAVRLRPLTEALAHLFRTEPILEHPSLRPYRSALGGLIPEYRSPGAPPVPASPVLLGEAVLRLLSVTGADRGCLLALEDLHDADPGTLAVVEYLADNVAGQGTLLLATVRQGPGSAWDLAQALSRRCSGTLLPLHPLDPPAVRLLAASRLGLAPEHVPEPVVDRLCRDSAGNPFLAGELVRAMLDSGTLVLDPSGCRLVDEVRTEVPSAVRHTVAGQATRLGPAGRQLLTAAAVIGERFPVSVLGQALRLDRDDLLRHVRAAVTAGLIAPGGDDHDWYAFRNPTTAVALLGLLTPADQAALAQRSAEAVHELHPDLPGEWCAFAARLAGRAGDVPEAARLLVLAGRRALNAGRLWAATETLERAWELAETSLDGPLRVDVLHELLCALVESGDAGRGLRLLDSLDDLCHPAVPPERLAAVHVQFARLACLAGRRADAVVQLEAARAVLGPDAHGRQTAHVDAVAAHLAVDTPEQAARLADRAVDEAERAGLPAVACLGWQARGVLASRRETDEAQACFFRMRQLADRHHLPLWRARATALLAEQRWLLTGDADALVRSAERTRRIGAQTLRHTVGSLLAWDQALRGRYAEAERLVTESAAEAQRLGLHDAVARSILVRAICAGHQGRRREVDEALAELRHAGGTGSPYAALVHGMAYAVCALLEEDPDRARDELARAARCDSQRAAPYPLAGEHGLGLLLDVLRGEADWRRCREVGESGPGRLRWNRQFGLLAEAVLLGRQGRREQAEAAVTAVRRGPHPVAVHLGLRLVAEAARTDRWGEPVDWLRQAEEYFRQAGLPTPARACRAELRRSGVVVPHRRDTSRVPPPLRLKGVTEREYEVLELMADWSDNRSIASELFISPRTVEKHVASLIAKTEQANRAALSRYAARFRQ